MNYKEVKKELKKEYEFLLKPLGYKSKNDMQGCIFRINKDSIIYEISFGVVNYIDEFKT
jgi:hypothetical protein